MLGVERTESGWKIQPSEHFKQSDIAQFYFHTSYFPLEEKSRPLPRIKKGREIIVDREDPVQASPEDNNLMLANLVSKMLAAGLYPA